MNGMRFINENEVIDYIKNELWRRRNERYQLMAFDEIIDLVEDAIDSADGVYLEESAD